jgi:integrase
MISPCTQERVVIKLTKTAIDALATPASGQGFLWDSEVRNFGVRVTTGGVKTFVIRYRNADGRSRRLSLGRYGTLTIDQARTQARIKLGAVAAGSDPAEERQQRRQAPTVTEICDWYLEEAEAGRLLGRRNLPIKKSTLYMDRSRIERHIKPLLGSRKVASLDAGEIARFQADVAAGKTSKARRSGRGRNSAGGAGAASRSVTTLSALFGHAKRMSLIKENPAIGVRKLASTPRERRLSTAEIVRFGQAMRELADFGEPKKGLDLIRLLALTGFRLNEGQGIRRPWVDADQRVILFPDTKSGSQRRPVGRAAMDIIDDQPIDAGSDFVFPADLSENHYRQGPDVILRIVMRAQLQNVTAHTLRHTFGSVAGDLGFSELTIKGMLGHGKRGVTQGYIHIDEGLRLAIECTSNKIADLLDGKSASVTPIASLKEAYESIAA